MLLSTIGLCIGLLLLIGLVVQFLKWLFRKATGKSSSSGGFFDGDLFDGFSDSDSGGGDSGGGD